VLIERAIAERPGMPIHRDRSASFMGSRSQRQADTTDLPRECYLSIASDFGLQIDAGPMRGMAGMTLDAIAHLVSSYRWNVLLIATEIARNEPRL